MHWTGGGKARSLILALLGAGALTACGVGTDNLCGDSSCEFAPDVWERIASLAGLEEPPPDPSNKYVGNADAEALGQKFYFDARFSGNATLVDMLKRPVQYARAASGQPINISCATCHNPARAGSDFTSIPGHVSVGAGWYDVNGQQTVNAAFYELLYWNGRSDSLWTQVMAVNESPVSMNSTRLKNAWIIKEIAGYKAAYDALFPEYPIPMPGTQAEAAALVASYGSGQCAAPGGACPAGCRTQLTTAGVTACVAQWPAQGKPGSKAGCQAGDSTEPFFDAWDCMAAADKSAVTRVFVNFAKAIAAYEYKLISKNAPFDQWVAEGPKSNKISAAAKRGAALFVGKASCIECHSTPFFSDNGFHNIGVAQVGAAVPSEADCPAGNAPCDCVNGTSCLPWGIWDGLKKLKANFAGANTTRMGSWSDDATDDSRKMYLDLTLTDDLKGTWRTPSLRDVALTAPYMHTGSLRTLEEVIWHYNAGGSTANVAGTKSVQLKPLHLTTEEEQDLVAFLQTLNGEPLPQELTVSPALP